MINYFTCLALILILCGIVVLVDSANMGFAKSEVVTNCNNSVV